MPGAPCTQTLTATSLRTISSCSGWIVETMSRIGPVRGRSISAARSEPAGEPRLLGLAQVLVLEGGEATAVDAEPAPQHDVHRLERRGPVERGRDRGAPVDDDGVARLVGDVPSADVELLGRPVGGVDVDAAEEEGRARVVLQRGDAPRQHPAEHLAGDRVARLRRVERLGEPTHPGQLLAGVVEVGLLPCEFGVEPRSRGSSLPCSGHTEKVRLTGTRARWMATCSVRCGRGNGSAYTGRVGDGRARFRDPVAARLDSCGNSPRQMNVRGSGVPRGTRPSRPAYESGL